MNGSLDTLVMPLLSHMTADSELLLRASRCLSVNTPGFCHQNLRAPWTRDVWACEAPRA